jgi:xanthine dehydrogenase accessory factor
MTDNQPPSARQDPWSASTQDLHEALAAYRSSETPAVVATIVDVEGSAYRRPGAMMVIDPDADSFGAITAGCLEGPVQNLAASVLEANEPTVERFDLMEDDGEWGLGLGCNGVIDILLEPLDASWDPIVAALTDRNAVATLTAIDSTDPAVAVGDRAVYDGDAVTEAESSTALPDSVSDRLLARADNLEADAASTTVSVSTGDGDVDVYVDWIAPAPDLLLFGSQNDIHPVARIGHQAGFRVVVASPRGARADADQFPHAHVVEAVRPMEVSDVVADAGRTYAVLMSHNLLEDRLALDALLDTAVPYIGLMGPRERFDEVREQRLADDAEELTQADLDRIATPVGLDLGGGEPIQIGLSIVSEALAVHNGRQGGRLKHQQGPIHERVDSEKNTVDAA